MFGEIGSGRQWGTVGRPTPVRSLRWDASEPVALSAHAPPSGPVLDLYREYMKADLASLAFRREFLRGLSTDEDFARRFVQFDATYREGVTGRDVLAALTTDRDLEAAVLGEPESFGVAYEVGDAKGRIDTLRTLLVEASARVTNAMVIESETGLVPVTENAAFARLLALRLSEPRYVGGTPRAAPLLGLEIARAIIPDEALKRLSLKDVLAYRRKTKDVYDAWITQLGRFAAELDADDVAQVEERARKLVATDIVPKIREYRNELEAARDALFGDLIKSVAKWELPTMSLALFAQIASGDGLLVFLGALVSASVGPVVDYIKERRQATQKHGVAYLVGLVDASRGA